MRQRLGTAVLQFSLSLFRSYIAGCCQMAKSGNGKYDSAVISIVVPAFNEEHYLPSTLAGVKRSVGLLQARHQVSVEIVVVDNASTDATASVASSLGARVVFEPEHNIA